MHTDWPEADVQAYYLNAKRDIKELKNAGHKIHMKERSETFQFLNEDVKVPVTSLHDISDFILEGYAASVAVSNGQLERLSWESILYGDQPLDGLGAATKVPERLLMRRRMARTVMARITGKWGPTRTLCGMVEDLVKFQKDATDVCRSACLEVGFALQRVSLVAEAWIKKEILKTVAVEADTKSGKVEEVDVVKVLGQVNAVRNNQRYACVPQPMRKDTESLILFLTNFGSQQPNTLHPADPGISPFLKSVLESMAKWLAVEKPLESGAGAKKLFKVKEYVVGADAAMMVYNRLKSAAEGDRREDDLLLVRTYRFLLPREFGEHIDSWVNMFIRNAKKQ